MTPNDFSFDNFIEGIRRRQEKERLIANAHLLGSVLLIITLIGVAVFS